MTPSPAAVTAQGVREGERGALAALVERRGAAVLAYCDHQAAPDRALEAAGEAFAAFRRAVRSAEDPVALDPEALLLQATRRAAATRAPRPAAPNGLLRRRRAATCQVVPELLAARADGELSAADRLRLGRHVEHCEDCRAAEERFVGAERAYVDAPTTPPEAGVAGGLLAALRAAAPNLDERAAPPHPPAETFATKGNGASATVAPDEPAAGTEPAGPPTLSWDPAELLAAAEAAEQQRDWGALAARIVVPAVVAVVAGVVALIVAGAFSGGGADNPATSIQTKGIVPPATVRVLQRPATTPLPPSTSSTSPSSSSSSPVPPQAARRVSSDTRSAPARSVRAVVPPARRTTATVDAAGTGGTEAAPPTNGGAPASSRAGFTPSP